MLEARRCKTAELQIPVSILVARCQAVCNVQLHTLHRQGDRPLLFLPEMLCLKSPETSGGRRSDDLWHRQRPYYPIQGCVHCCWTLAVSIEEIVMCRVHCIFGGMFARRAPGALLLDYVPPKEPPSTPFENALRIR